MKKRLLALLLVLTLSVSCLFSCQEGGGANTEDPGTEDNGGEAKEAIRLQAIVHADDFVDSVDYRTIINSYQKISNKRLTVYAASDCEYTEGLLYVGPADTSVSRRATSVMNGYLKKHNTGIFDIPYAIYSDGTDVSVVWEELIISDKVVVKLIERMQSLDIAAGEKFSEAGVITIGAEYEVTDAQNREAAIKKAEDKLGAEAAQALRDHMQLATDEVYVWLANLYEPRTCICENYDEYGYRVCLLPKDENGNYLCHGGGFYYCNSARDTEGYYIDIESTLQALNFLTGEGILSSLGQLDGQMKRDILAFALSLQSSEDGYFYHPQWGSNISVSRRGRDLGWSTSVISTFGGQPLYDTPNGVKGTLGAPGKKDAALSSPLTDSSAAVAVSKLVLAAAWPSHLSSLSAFEVYLDSFDLKSSSYPTGNTFSSQTAQIKQRDKEGLANGEFNDTNGDGKADDGLVAAFERHFNAAQNPENGLWESGVDYNSVNGLMKISGAYSSLGLKLPNAAAAFMSAVEVALLPAGVADAKGKMATGSVDVYNPWVALSNVMGNMRTFGGSAEAEELRRMLCDNAAEMIRVTTEKTKKFAKPDGSYGYTWNSPPEYSQSAKVCPAGYIEGDVNGGFIAVSGIWDHMCSALGISINLYGAADGQKILYIFDKLEPVIKYDYD